MRSAARFRVVAVFSGLMACSGSVAAIAAPGAPARPAVPAAAAQAPGAPAAAPGARPATRPAAPAPAAQPPAAAPAPRPAPPVAAKPPGPEPLPTMDEMKLWFEQAKYQDLLRNFPRVLTLRGKAAEPYNKYELWMLKFETHMKMKAQSPALAALKDAQAVTDDVKRINYCKSVDLLIKRSKSFLYQPSPQKKEKPPTIDITDPDARKLALRAMLADEMAVIGPKVEKALGDQSLPRIADALKSLQGLDILESAADGGDETQKLVGDLRTRGVAIMAKAVIRQSARTDEIVRTANELIRIPVSVPNPNGTIQTEYRMRKRGLDTDGWRELREIMKSADDLIPNIRGLAEATGAKLKDVEDLLNAAEDMKRKADKALKANYNEL